jgi:hypothetical protein
MPAGCRLSLPAPNAVLTTKDFCVCWELRLLAAFAAVVFNVCAPTALIAPLEIMAHGIKP